jgi:hypothetical protein
MSGMPMAGQLSPNSYEAISSLYNPRMASLHHGVEEPGELVVWQQVLTYSESLGLSQTPKRIDIPQKRGEMVFIIPHH